MLATVAHLLDNAASATSSTRDFRGKTGKELKLKLSDRRVARIVRSCQELPGQHLQYEDGDGVFRRVSSADVNDYIRDIAGAEVTAKDFRTWAGTVLAAMALREFEPVEAEASAKRNIREAMKAVAARLGNTPAICRKCYVHPEVLAAYLDGKLAQLLDKAPKRAFAALPAEEAATPLPQCEENKLAASSMATGIPADPGHARAGHSE